ncbi:TRNA pseudouridine synthase [Penicillium macrosclerotiorum]|uniref:TRNA pseudouridine synthase n=1 Tax=Penicillium macrosclerotiorum TaxID=303699 RepID=UPI002546FC9E|nr:TRNA pseudouridine synthase [Penicillium macrosclerotiorum]KAJ5668960.1 TRNA pseudouridine synthase [Penicillium macrosclerotiorum]
MADNQTGGDRAGEGRKKRDMGRSEWSRQKIDKRARSDQQAETKRRKLENGEEVAVPIYATEFSKEEIEQEERRPKKKVALLMGYSGTGYYGMQLTNDKKTIEGELFTALVAAGAVSKANATDPKKSSFARCARTDKGVHAAGNVVSLKMIIEDPDIVQKINEKLSPQIRVWGIEQTAKSFNCYQLCDSRVYDTFLGTKIVELAKKAGDLEEVAARQEEVSTYWDEVDEKYIKPILETVPDDIRNIVQKSLFFQEEENASDANDNAIPQPQPETESAQEETKKPFKLDPRQQLIHDTIKAVKAAYLTARRAYRIPSSRVARLQESLSRYEGTRNFHNYTIQKTYKDPSASRFIRSFKVNPTPVVINGTEWLSLKVHGQSFMMHQIRKMVAMAALVVRCGCHPDRINDTYGPDRVAIPKAPGLGLLLERPIFDSYSSKAKTLGREPINFDKFEKEMDEFKQREIYDRIFREEAESAAFGSFFNHIDHFTMNHFLYVTSGGIAASTQLASAADGKPGNSKALTSEKSGNNGSQALAAVESESEDEGDLPNREDS